MNVEKKWSKKDTKNRSDEEENKTKEKLQNIIRKKNMKGHEEQTKLKRKNNDGKNKNMVYELNSVKWNNKKSIRN